ncbi:MAG: NUDIX hydrolase [Bacteroidales bacterium]|nr:NUDIX hydrolase [Bacteroidales bacterium]MDT8432190.1 NUDIX hydrolase [Bacteroidales bacterium]
MRYNCALTTDCVIFKGDVAVLIRRKYPPFQGMYALPGGFVEEGETVEAACAREAKEETGLDVRHLRFVGVYAEPDRDPRGRTVSCAFLAEADLADLQAGDDAAAAELVEHWQDEDLAFDHMKILLDALELRRASS